VFHYALVFPNAMGDVLQIEGPSKMGELRDPARQRHIAHVAAAVDEPGLGNTLARKPSNW